MIIYGLKALGADSLTGSPLNIYSRKIFTTKEKALIYKDEFLKRCVCLDYIDTLDSDEKISIKIIEYTIDEEM